MKHVCVAARTVDNAKRREADIQNISKRRDKVSGRSGCNPKGWHEFSPICCVGLLGGNWGQTRISATWSNFESDPKFRSIVALLDLSENRDSASRVSLCYRL